VTDSPDSRPTVRRAIFVLDYERYRQFFEVIDYVEMRHAFIDPDMFRIDLAELSAFKKVFELPDEEPASVTLSFTYAELFALENIVHAADAYSHRKTEPAIYGITDQQLTGLHDWLARSIRWFVTPIEDEA
jgi:hypothetical protein